MEDRFFGEGPGTGVHCPDSMALAKAYGIKGVRIETPGELTDKLREVLRYDGPVLCDVLSPEWQLIVPRVSSDKKDDGTLVSRKFEDMFPYLPEAELAENMVAERE
jgi:acetolactate synthase-1/2/3 large subunit